MVGKLQLPSQRGVSVIFSYVSYDRDYPQRYNLHEGFSSNCDLQEAG